MNKKKNSLGKGERLKNKATIKKLFDSKNLIKAYPFLVLYQIEPSDGLSAQIGVSVPKRKFKKAVDRNKIKRRIREAFRTQKETLLNKTNNKIRCTIMFIYIGNEILKYNQIDKGMGKSLNKLNKKIYDV